MLSRCMDPCNDLQVWIIQFNSYEATTPVAMPGADSDAPEVAASPGFRLAHGVRIRSASPKTQRNSRV